MEAREHILAALVRRLRRGADDPERGGLESELEHPVSNLIPGRANVSGDDCVRLFEEMARTSLASVQRITALESLPRHVASYLDVCQLPRVLVVSSDPRLDGLDWRRAGVEVHSRPVRDGDAAALAPAFCGIAETGTLMFLSGSEHGSASSFLPDHHLVVVWQRDVIGGYEQAWERLRARGGGMPRTVNWVTGPSRSADIELTMLMGAHGPLALHVIVVADDG
ncbi:MAG: LUD domain-containing protein [Gammaproteobacteria bacterium]